MRSRTTYYHDHVKDDGETLALELEYKADSDVTVVETEDKIIVGYLVQDEMAENPLEYCDGMGAIHHHPRSRYGRRGDDGYYDALGLDSGGDPIIDEDNLQQMWTDAVNALPLKLFHIEDRQIRESIKQYGTQTGYRESLRDALAQESVSDFTLALQAAYAWGSLGVPESTRDEIVERIEDVIQFDYDKAVEACRKPGDPDAVLLDLYDHSGCVWSVSGAGMNCRFDTSRGESVWVPDKCLREELEEIKDPQERYDQAVKYAKQAVEAYNAWSCGDVYGIVVQTHDKEGVMLDVDAVWGHIGIDWAEEALAEDVAWRVDRQTRLASGVQA